MRIDPAHIYVIITERDTDDPFRADGAIVFEVRTNLDYEEVEERAKKLRGKYGRVWIGKLPYSNITEVKPEGSNE